GEGDRPFGPEFAEGTLFETCMRRMVLAFMADESFVNLRGHTQKAEDTIYRSEKAYQFLLEVVCGLKSPVKGETEVQGQFRDFIESLGETHQLKNLMVEVLRDARKVRTEFLNGLGGQSYGSFARRRLREFQNVHVVGTGHLAEELFPWLAKIPSQVHVY